MNLKVVGKLIGLGVALALLAMAIGERMDWVGAAQPAPGTLKWRYGMGRRRSVVSSPAIGADGTIYVGSYYDNYLYAINPDGTRKWRYETGYWVESSPAIGADGTIYVGSLNFYAINPDGTLKWWYDTGYHDVDSSPAIGADGTIYVGSGGLYAINSSSLGLAASPWPMFRHDIQHTGRVIVAWPWTEKEPNDSFVTANYFPLPFQVRGAISPLGDKDFFAFKGVDEATIIIDIDAQAIGSALDSYISLYDEDGDVIASNDDAIGEDSRLQVTLNYTGTYYIEVRASGDSSTGPYVLTVIHY